MKDFPLRLFLREKASTLRLILGEGGEGFTNKDISTGKDEGSSPKVISWGRGPYLKVNSRGRRIRLFPYDNLHNVDRPLNFPFSILKGHYKLIFLQNNSTFSFYDFLIK